MSDRIKRSVSDPDRFLRGAAVAFAIGFSIHTLDHLRRGLSASPTRVIIVGTIQSVLVVVAIWMTLRRHDAAPSAAIVVGFGSALLFTYGHLLPISLDSFVSPPRTNVTWFSWFSALAEIGTGLVFGAAGVRVRAKDRPSADRARAA